MNIPGNYEQHVSITKELKMSDSFYEVREPHKEGFEEIYNEAKEKGIEISTAKDFLNSLTEDELSTLQHYTLLVDDINVSKLDDEGAYNLLLHHYEKYDFNEDGLISNGIAKSMSLLPVNMPSDEKEILVETLNGMDEKERFLTLLMINPPQFQLMDDGTIMAKENDNYMNYQTISNRIQRILNPLPGEYSSPEIQNTLSKFLDIYSKNLEQKKEQEEYIKKQNEDSAQLTKAKIYQ